MKSALSRTPQSGQRQLSGTSDQGCRPGSPHAGSRVPRRRRSRSPGTARHARRAAAAARVPPRVTRPPRGGDARCRRQRMGREHCRSPLRADVGPRRVAAVVGEHARVHHAAPGGWNERQQDHPRVAGGQRRRLLVVAQGLVAPGRVRVVVAVALQVVEQDVRGDVVGVPAVPRLDALVPLLARDSDDLAQQAVVLEVVDRLEQREADERLDARGTAAMPAPSHATMATHSTTVMQPGVQHVVAEAGGVPAGAVPVGAARVARRWRASRGRCAARTRRSSRRAGCSPGPRASRRGHGGRGCARCRSARRQLCARAILDSHRSCASRLWPELVGGVDAEPGDEADGHREPDLVHDREVAGGDEPERRWRTRRTGSAGTGTSATGSSGRPPAPGSRRPAGSTRSSPVSASIVGTTPRMTMGPSQNHTPQPVSANRPSAANGSAGMISATSQRYRLWSRHSIRRPSVWFTDGR